MPRYFFHIRTGTELLKDLDGLELPDEMSIQEECARIIKEVLREDEWRNDVVPGREFQVVDELGQTILVVPFADILGA